MGTVDRFDPRRARGGAVRGLLALLLAVTLAACGDGEDPVDAAPEDADGAQQLDAADGEPEERAGDDTPEDSRAAFPVTVGHAFGETEIEAEPERVVAWGWGSADAAIALDVVPVAIPFQGYGGDETGVLPWIAEAVGEQGAEMPGVLPEGDAVPYEAIAAAEPDVILAVYSGITEDDYALLSEIAPTVAYPDDPWATPWRETIEIVGTSLGRSDQAAEVLTEIDDAIAAEAEAHPEFEGVTVAQVWDTGDTFYVYEPADPRVGFTSDLGFEVAPAVEELSTGESTFFYTLSHERLNELSSDLLVAYADTQAQMDSFLASGPAQLMPQVQEARVAQVVGQELVASVSPPTALSLIWGLDDYVSTLADAVASGA